jgi:hypothetical protein
VPGINVVAVGPNGTVTDLFIDDAAPYLNGGYLLATAPGSAVTNLCSNDKNPGDFDLLGSVMNDFSSSYESTDHCRFRGERSDKDESTRGPEIP